MARKRIKKDYCTNCQYEFQADENYCPECGQENNNPIKSTKQFSQDLVDDLLQIDNRFFRSIIPFLFRPGKLTNEYINGRRKRFAPPIRIYLIWSFIYFFIFSIEFKRTTGLDDINKSNKTLIQENKESFDDNIKILPDSSERFLQISDSLIKYMPNADSTEIRKLANRIAAREDSETDTLEDNQNIDKINVNIGNESFSFGKMTRLAARDGITEDEVMDSLNMNKNNFNRLLVHQTIRLANATPRELTNEALEKIPIILFFILPVFSLLLKLVYMTQKRFLVEHFIFTLHIHSFYFFVFTILLILNRLAEAVMPLFIAISVIIILVYGYASFLNVYKDGIVKTFIKKTFVETAYLFILVILMTFAILVSLLLY